MTVRAMTSSLFSSSTLRGASQKARCYSTRIADAKHLMIKDLPPWARRPDVLLQTHRDAHAAADAEGGETLLGLAPAHLEQKRHEHAGARRANGMADRDGAAIDVHLGGIKAQILVHR